MPTSKFAGSAHELGSNSATPEIGMHGRVQEKSMFTPIRRDIHEANQPIVLICSQVNEGTAEERAKVAAVVDIPARREQAMQRLVF